MFFCELFNVMLQDFCQFVRVCGLRCAHSGVKNIKSINSKGFVQLSWLAKISEVQSTHLRFQVQTYQVAEVVLSDWSTFLNLFQTELRLQDPELD